ncbi:alpha-2-macroglobulin [Planctomycetota bacterium]
MAGRGATFSGARRSVSKGGGMKAEGEMVADAMAAPAASAPGAPREKAKSGADKDRGAGAEPAFAEATVRQKFADTAIWLTTLTTDDDGIASATVDMPENLTTWKINSWAMTGETKVGQASTEAVTTKNLLVRLQAPRFFMEYDEVVISANVHNYLAKEKTARVSLEAPTELLGLMKDTPAAIDVKVPANGEKRIDWRVKVLKEGLADITVKALTDEESDAMKMSFPVLVHGITKQIASTGSIKPDEDKAVRTVEIVVPDKRRPELSRLEVQFAPSLVGAMLDALPYCLSYPYGCTEQTMSRFLPAVLTLKTLQNMGIKLEDVKNVRGKLDEVRRIEKGENIKVYGYAHNPVFDSAEMQNVISKGLKRIADMQHGDGGWSWWKQGDSSGYMSSYVLYSLVTAQRCDVEVDQNIVQRGMRFLKSWEERKMREEYWGPHASHAYTAYVLSLGKKKAAIKPGKGDKRPGDLIDRLYQDRDKLTLYGKALLSMALANHGDVDRAKLVLQNIMQYKEENAETELAWFRTPTGGWWYWYNNDIETNAWCLRALIKLQPKSDVAPKIVKWLLENRRNGYYWRSTRDTTMCIAAMSDFVTASGEGKPDYTLTLDFDNGATVKTVKISADNFFTYDNRFVLDGVALTGGKHSLKITKEGKGALYYSTYLSYFTKEEDIKAAGLQLKVERTYHRLEQIPYEVEVMGAEGQKIKEKRLRYKRVPVESGDQVDSGDVIQVELKITSDNNYTYLCFEDMKPAGCEATEVRSGGKRQEGFYTYMELRDEKVVFFLNSIEQGSHLLRYRLRAETPGIFHALPSVVYGMYVPELRANSNELVMKIIDK